MTNTPLTNSREALRQLREHAPNWVKIIEECINQQESQLSECRALLDECKPLIGGYSQALCGLIEGEPVLLESIDQRCKELLTKLNNIKGKDS